MNESRSLILQKVVVQSTKLSCLVYINIIWWHVVLFFRTIEIEDSLVESPTLETPTSFLITSYDAYEGWYEE